MPTVISSLLALKYIVAFTEEQVSAFMHLIAMVTEESPVDLTTFKRYAMVSPLAENQELRMISPQKQMRISYHEIIEYRY